MRKFVQFSLISIFFLLLGAFLLLLLQLYRGGPKVRGKVSLEGLSEEVRIFRDEWGVPHIFSQNEKDLFFACGYVHAQERMWQMDVTRRAGFGRLSEVLGKASLERDKVMRNLGLKEAAQRDFENLTPEMKEVIYAYADGINAWIKSRKFNWPPEFLLLRYRPQFWSPLDSLIIKEVMSLILCRDYHSEAMRARLVKSLGKEKACQILEEGIPPPPIEAEGLSLSTNSLPLQGSNNWVVSGKRTVSGKPLLANDPHLEISLPPIWYELHIHCPSLNAIGVTIPGVPFIVIGHNQSIAWGMTNSGADVQDLFIEKLNSPGDLYFDKDEWKPLQKKREEIRVKGKKSATIEVSWTVRGPIITPHIIKSELPLSLSWSIYEGGRSPEALYLLNKAQTWQEFAQALAFFDVPSQNFVYADTVGNIGYYLSGKIPRRPAETALFPFPGWEEKGQWRGYLAEETKPYRFNPEEGFIVTANNKIISEDFPHYISFDWDEAFRAERIKDLLFQKEKHDLGSFKRIQNDIYSKEGELIFPILEKMSGAKGEFKKALDMIQNWDLTMGFGKEPALFKVFMRFFCEDVFKDELGEDFEEFNDLFRRKKAGLLRIISDPLSPWFDKADTKSIETREDIVRMSLERAYEWLEKSYGQSQNWDWMKMNAFHYRHSLGRVSLFKFFNRGPYPLSGDANTIKTSFTRGDGTIFGVSFRQIIDLSNLNNSVCVLTSGQSGYYLSRHYDDQIPLWLEGQYHPMLFDSGEIADKAIEVLILKPKKGK